MTWKGFFQAIQDTYNGSKLAIPIKEAVAISNEFNNKRNAEMQEKRQRQAAANLAESQAFLAKNRHKKGGHDDRPRPAA